MLGFEHQLAAGLCDAGLQAHLTRLHASAGAFGPHGQQRLHAAFVPGAACLDALAQPGLFLGQLLVELLLVGRFVGQRRVAAPQERRVVAGPRGQPPAIEFDDAGRQLLEEGAVVGDEEHGAGVVGQLRLEPRDGLDVEMVGRLVEQQQVRLRDQRPGEQRAAAPAT